MFSDEQVVAIMAAIARSRVYDYMLKQCGSVTAAEIDIVAARNAQNLFDAVRAERARRFTYRPDEAKE